MLYLVIIQCWFFYFTLLKMLFIFYTLEEYLINDIPRELCNLLRCWAFQNFFLYHKIWHRKVFETNDLSKIGIYINISRMQLYKFALWGTLYNNSINKVIKYTGHSSLSIIIAFLGNTESV